MNSSSTDFSTNKGRDSPASSNAPSTASIETPSTSIPAAYVADKAPEDSSKLRTLLSILRKFIGVADIASVRFSLPAQLLEPTPNLEYWNYLDRPEVFIRLVTRLGHRCLSRINGLTSIGDSDDELGRMLEVLRFWFTKDLKYVKGRPCKPYNSTLGEFFRCNWDVTDDVLPIYGGARKATAAASIDTTNKLVRVSYITEQTSHHPPVSAFFVDCPAKGISARGFDQLSAKFTGTSIRVTPGAHNLGIFINIHRRGNEEYQLTHPTAHLGGLIRGSLSVTVADTCFITCPKTEIKVILHYLEESWLGKAQNRVVGVIYKYDPDDDNITRVKDVPEQDILARIEGSWQDQVQFTLSASSEPQLLIDLKPLFPIAKIVPPEKDQLPNESRRFWAEVTQAIVTKQYGQATKLKQELEERQRDKAAERESRNEEWKPRFFTEPLKPNGRPELTEEGRLALQGLQAADYHLDESVVTGA